MSELVYFLVVYGVCFGLMFDKIPVVRRVRCVPMFDRMFRCAYCTGFHCGWVVWVLTVGLQPDVPEMCVQGFLRGFASAAFCYTLDTVLRWAEAGVPTQTEEE